MNKNYFYSKEEEFTSNMFDAVKGFEEYINYLKYYKLYFEERIKHQEYKAKKDLFDDDSYFMILNVEAFYERMMNKLTIYDDFQEYIIHEDEDSVALSYVGNNDFYELQEKRWLIMLEDCKKIYFIYPEDKFYDEDEYMAYYEITIYERDEERYTCKTIKLEDYEELGLPELNVEFDTPKIWIKKEILDRALCI